MRIFTSYIRAYLLWIVFCVALIMFQMAFMTLAGMEKNDCIYGLILESIVFIIVFFVGFVMYFNKYMKLSRTTLLDIDEQSDVPETEDCIEQLYQEIVENQIIKRKEMKADKDKSKSEMLQYYGMWVHQIKTPISSMRLLLDGEDSKEARKVASELNRIEQYVEMVLTYLRLDSQTNDFVFRKCCIDEIVRQSIKRFARDFISKKLSLDYTGIEGDIVTDSKWFGFVIEQVLSNALKYTYECGIRIYRQEDILVISDTGIGIATEDLPRVFENSYTGYNGRSKEASSGIGLYLCKRICDSLGVKLCIASEVAKGTSVYIGLTQDNVVFKD